MSIFFGFIPSEALLANIQQIQKQRHSNQALYLIRDQIALQINDEILDQVLGQLIADFPESDKRDTALKLLGYVKSTVQLLLKQLLSKSSNTEVQASIDFIQQSLFIDQDNQLRIGAPIDATLAKQLKANFAALSEAKASKTITPVLQEQYKQLSNQVIQHFMLAFYHTLALGMIKRKAADIGTAAVTKAMHIGIDKLLPRLSSLELQHLSQTHDRLVHLL